MVSGRPDGRAAYTIEGSDMQYVEIELEPGEVVVAEAGSMMYMDAGIQMEEVFGDGSGKRGATSWASSSQLVRGLSQEKAFL